MRRRFPKRRQTAEPTVNLTPLLDVVFVVLIMFIVIAPLLDVDSIALAPASNAQEESTSAQPSPVCVYVRKDNTLTFNQKAVALSQLSDVLRSAKSKYPQERLQIFQDEEAHFGTYQRVKNAAEEAGYKEMDVVLKPASTKKV